MKTTFKLGDRVYHSYIGCYGVIGAIDTMSLPNGWAYGLKLDDYPDSYVWASVGHLSWSEDSEEEEIVMSNELSRLHNNVENEVENLVNYIDQELGFDLDMQDFDIKSELEGVLYENLTVAWANAHNTVRKVNDLVVKSVEFTTQLCALVDLLNKTYKNEGSHLLDIIKSSTEDLLRNLLADYLEIAEGLIDLGYLEVDGEGYEVGNIVQGSSEEVYLSELAKVYSAIGRNDLDYMLTYVNTLKQAFQSKLKLYIE